MKKIIYLLVCTLVFSQHFLFAQERNDHILLDQEGFYSDGPKMAVVTDTTATRFFITSADTRDTVYKGLLSAMRKSVNSSTRTRIAVFDAFQKPGLYRVVVPGAGNSYAFKIGDHVHYAAAIAAIKGFYYQRVSMPLEKQYAGKWARAAGHPDTAVLIHPSAETVARPAGTKISTPGGWYDAGDYNKYIVNSGISMGTLLSAYEDFSSYFDTLHTNIPESGNGVPDLLDEIVYNLRWMLSMQDPNDGGVYNKCTNAAFDKMVMPGVTKLPRYVVQKGTAATLDFAAVTAQASRLLKHYGKQLPGLSDSCMAAAIKAWGWTEKNPSLEYDQNAMNKKYSPAISTGGYGDKWFDDEWFWAASELLVTTGDKKFKQVLLGGMKQPFALPSWSNVRALGWYSLIRNEKKFAEPVADSIALLKKQLIHVADNYIAHVPGTAFETVMGKARKDFIWGSNANAANQGIVLINAYLVTKNRKYIDYALTNLDYILGRNATGYCFITGIGTRSTMHPHHRPSVADGIDDPVPGLLAAGPNPGMQDHCTYPYSEPETAYVDSDCAYASNEIAINWNAPLVYLLNAIEALQYKVGYSR